MLYGETTMTIRRAKQFVPVMDKTESQRRNIMKYYGEKDKIRKYFAKNYKGENIEFDVTKNWLKVVTYKENGHTKISTYDSLGRCIEEIDGKKWAEVAVNTDLIDCCFYRNK